MLVVADATPLNVLIRIGCVGVLPTLFERIVIPEVVLAELTAPRTPESLKAWMSNRPAWLTVQRVSRLDSTLPVDAGEREAICLALELKADLLLADDAQARKTAARLGLRVTGTVGVLELAAAKGLLSLPDAFAGLRRAGFFIDDHVLASALRRDQDRRSR